MLGIAYLNEIITHSDVDFSAASILDRLRDMVINSLRQTGEIGQTTDGMDMAICIVDKDKNTVQYAGANNPLVLIRNNELEVYKPDRMPVGIFAKQEPFKNSEVELKHGDILYMYSDGYADQIGGVGNRKFLSRNFRQLLLKISERPIQDQKAILKETLQIWKNPSVSKSYNQIDDILVIGYKHQSNNQ